jgi:hypothetical protein
VCTNGDHQFCGSGNITEIRRQSVASNRQLNTFYTNSYNAYKTRYNASTAAVVHNALVKFYEDIAPECTPQTTTGMLLLCCSFTV